MKIKKNILSIINNLNLSVNYTTLSPDYFFTLDQFETKTFLNLDLLFLDFFVIMFTPIILFFLFSLFSGYFEKNLEKIIIFLFSLVAFKYFIFIGFFCLFWY